MRKTDAPAPIITIEGELSDRAIEALATLLIELVELDAQDQEHTEA